MRVRAYHAEYAPATSSPVLLSETPTREGVTITLDRGARLRGKVVDEKGAPVPGAEIRVAGEVLHGGPLRRSAADANGEFAMTGLPRRMIFVAATSAGGSSPTAEVDLATGDKPPIVLKLTFAAEIAGVVVTSTGTPVAEARIEATVSAEGQIARFEHIDDYLRAPASAIADIEGRFKISGLEPGSYRLRAIRPGSSPHLIDAKLGVEVATGAPTVRIVIDDPVRRWQVASSTRTARPRCGSRSARHRHGESGSRRRTARSRSTKCRRVPSSYGSPAPTSCRSHPRGLDLGGKVTDLGSITCNPGGG
jgi:hypothetical protein